MPFFVLALVFSAISQARRESRIEKGLEAPPPPRIPVDFGAFWDGPYQFGAIICGGLSALVAWIIIGSSYGMWGLLLGWIPAAIIGVIAGFLWPVAAIATVIGIIAYINR